jgi:opacity protein-like surface antigen
MFKKILAITAIFVTSLSTAYAGAFYAGPAFEYDDFRAGHVRYSGIYPIVFGGYGDWVRDWLYVGGELFGGPKSIDVNNEPKNGQSLKTKYTYGVSIIPGVNLDDMLMAFIRFGFVSTKFQELETTKGGTQLGLGVESKVAECWSVRGEYIYTRYSSVSSAGNLRSDAFMLSGIYRFESSF